jgi:hypothetical protein
MVAAGVGELAGVGVGWAAAGPQAVRAMINTGQRIFGSQYEEKRPFLRIMEIRSEDIFVPF